MNSTLPQLILLINLILLPDCVIKAQINYLTEHYTSENGLPQNSIKYISQDSEGFVWLATEEGLTRFDGHKFYIFNRLNLATRNDRVYYLDRIGKDSKAPASGRNKSMFATLVGGAYIKIQHGKATKAPKDSAIYKAKTKLLTKDPEQFFETRGLPDVYIYEDRVQYQEYKITVDGTNGTFYLCGNKTFSYYKNDQKQYEKLFEVNDMFKYFSFHGKLYYYNQNSASATILSNKKNVTSTFSGDILNAPGFEKEKQKIKLYWNHISDQVFLYFKKELYIVDQHSDGSMATRKLLDGFDFDEPGIIRIHYDTINKKLFLGSNTNGLYVITLRQFQTLSLKGKERNVFYGHIPFGANQILTADGLQVGLDSLTGKVIDKKLPVIQKANAIDKRVIVRDKNGTIWFKVNATLLQINPLGTKILFKRTFNAHIRALHQVKTGAFFVGLQNGELYQIDSGTTKRRLHFIFKFSAKIAFTYLESLENGLILAGTNSGMYIVNASIKSVRLLKATKDLSIKSIHPQENDRVWITAQEKGLLLMNRKLQITSFPLDKDGFLANAHCVIRDGLGYLWITTNRGLFQVAENDLLSYAALTSKATKVNNTELFYAYHSMDEGFRTNEFNGNCQSCAVKLSNGYLSLPSLKGLVWFKPENIRQFHSERTIILDRVTVNQTPLALDGDTLHLPYNPENINLYFSTVNWNNIKNQKLSYALLNENSNEKTVDWTPINNEDFVIHYSTQASGNYTLVIRKLNGYGLNDYSLKKIYILIPPLWYETWWARLIFSTALTLLVYLIVNYRTRSIQEKNEQLELLVKERTESLNYTVAELNQSKNEMSDQLRLLSRILASISHDIQSPLTYIAFASSTIKKMTQNGELENVAKLGAIISDVSNRMSFMLKDLLDYVKTQIYGNKIELRDLQLADIVTNKIAIFNNTIIANDSVIYNEVPSRLTVVSDHQLLSIIIHNLIDNAAKYTRGGEIRVYVLEANGQTELVISNSGAGLSPSAISFLNNDYKLGEDSAIDQKISGIGLFIVKEVAEIIGVDIRVTQTDKTSFHLNFRPVIPFP